MVQRHAGGELGSSLSSSDAPQRSTAPQCHHGMGIASAKTWTQARAKSGHLARRPGLFSPPTYCVLCVLYHHPPSSEPDQPAEYDGGPMHDACLGMCTQLKLNACAPNIENPQTRVCAARANGGGGGE